MENSNQVFGYFAGSTSGSSADSNYITQIMAYTFADEAEEESGNPV
jgi:hypothetical protein